MLSMFYSSTLWLFICFEHWRQFITLSLVSILIEIKRGSLDKLIVEMFNPGACMLVEVTLRKQYNSYPFISFFSS